MLSRLSDLYLFHNSQIRLIIIYFPGFIAGLLEYLCTEISTSKQKKFPLVTFVDSPGLVDGDMNYPFDVDEAIRWLGELVDLIFVFFDPIGQVCCTFFLLFIDRKQRSGLKYVLVQRLSIMALEKSQNQRDMNYTFDVDETIRWLGELVDLTFVFFDPIGQICCTFLFLIF